MNVSPDAIRMTTPYAPAEQSGPSPRVLRFTYACGDRPLEGYTIKRGIGIGGFGEVYFAISDAGKEVALKRIQRNPDIELRGVGHCLNLKHTNLIALWDVRTDSHGIGWVVMEYVPGESLRETIERFPEGLAIDEITEWFRGMLSGVKHLHDRGLVHRDLKPGNIFRDADNDVVKIGDYGLSKLMGGGRSGHTETVGTFHYMAPEVGRGVYGREIDLYALGIILYEMFTGCPPFDGETSHEIIMKHLTGDPDLTRIPPAFRRFLGRLLEKDPERRFRDAAEVAQVFERCLNEAKDTGIVAIPVSSSVALQPTSTRTAATTLVTSVSEETVKANPAAEIVLGELREIVVAEPFEPTIPAAVVSKRTIELREKEVPPRIREKRSGRLVTWSLIWRLGVVLGLLAVIGQYSRWVPGLALLSCLFLGVRWGLNLVAWSVTLPSKQHTRERLIEPHRFRRYYRELPESWMIGIVLVVAGIAFAMLSRGSLSIESWAYGAVLITTGLVAAGWATVLGRRWDGVREERLLQGLASLIAGLGTAVTLLVMLRWLEVDFHHSWGEVISTEGSSDATKPSSPLGTILAVIAVAIIPRWWRWAERGRPQRLSLTPIWGAVILGSLADLLANWPWGTGVLLAVVVAVAVQLAAPHEPSDASSHQSFPGRARL